MHIHTSCHVDNIVVCSPIEHMLSTISLDEIQLYILILSLLHIHSCTMEDNPLLVDMCLFFASLFAWFLVIPIFFIYKALLWCIHLIIWFIHSPLIICFLSCAISWSYRSWHFILALAKLFHGIIAIPNSYMVSELRKHHFIAIGDHSHFTSLRTSTQI